MNFKYKKTLCTALCVLLMGSLLGCGSVRSSANTTAASLILASDVTAGSEAAEADEILITLSDAGSVSDSAAVSIDGSAVTITAEGTYRLTGTLSDGQIVVSAPEDAKVKLILDGADITKSGSAAILALSADKVIVASAEGSVNKVSSTGEFDAADSIDAAIFAKCDLNLNGDGILYVSCETGHGVVTKDDLKMKDGTVSVSAAKKGVEGKDSITVEGGTLLITAGTKGLYSKNEDNEEDGNIEILGGSVTVTSNDDSIHAGNCVTVSGGELTLSSGDDGIHADATLAISGGSVTVLQSYEGLEAQVIDISGGVIDVTATDDGLNAAGGNDGSNGYGMFGGDPFQTDMNASLTISGGTLNVDAGGDGLDSNGALNVSGGLVTVSGPTNNGNGALDYGSSATITGGTVIAAGASGMAENFGSASTQGSILLSFSAQEAGSTVTITDESGTVLASCTPSKAYNSVLISTEALKVGGTYTITAGSYSETVTLTSNIYGNGMGMGGFGGGMGGHGGMGGPMGGWGSQSGEQPEGWGGEAGGFGGGPGGHGGMGGGPGRP